VPSEELPGCVRGCVTKMSKDRYDSDVATSVLWASGKYPTEYLKKKISGKYLV